MNKAFTRAPKQIGDFGEGLVTYALIRKGFEVAYVDHVGADLIAEKNSYRIAVSVKTRVFRTKSIESRVTVFETGHLEKLAVFAERFQLDPVLAYIATMVDDRKIHLFILRVDDIRHHLKLVKHGYSFRFGSSQIEHLRALHYVDYSCWSEECVLTDLFDGRGQSQSSRLPSSNLVVDASSIAD